VIKFGRVRFKIKKLAIDRSDIDLSGIEDIAESFVQGKKAIHLKSDSHSSSNLRVIATTDNENLTLNNGAASNSEPETRITTNAALSMNRVEQAGFDNRPISFDEDKEDTDLKFKAAMI